VAIAQSTLAMAVGSTEPALDVAGVAPIPSEMPALGIAMREAATRDPKLREALAQLKAQEAETKAIAAELRPELLITGTISGREGGAPASNGDRPDGAGFLPDVPNWDAGLVLSWPLLDGTIDARKRASRAKENERREEVEVARLALVTAVQQAYVAVDVARAAVPGLEGALKAAVENYAQAEARFKAGLGNSVELADAAGLRADAEIQLALGRFELARSRAAFGRAIAEGL
jgi:outer membrane protein